MAKQSTSRFSLADLVTLVLLCGWLASFVSAISRRGSTELHIPALFVGAVVWALIRMRQQSPACEICGRRFVPPRPMRMTDRCPHCGAEPIRLIWSIRRWRMLFWSLVPVLVLSLIFLTAAFSVPPSTPSPFEGRRLGVVVIAAGLGVLSAVVMRWAHVGSSRLEKPRDRTCEECAEMIPASSDESRICPACRHRKMTHAQAERQQARQSLFSPVGIAVSLFLVVLAGSTLFMAIAKIRSGGWRDLPILLVPTPIVALLCFLFWWTWRAGRVRRLLNEERTWDVARSCAGEDGTIVRDGAATVWYSGPDDPVPMIREAAELSRRRITAWFGAVEMSDPAIRIIAFHDAGAYRAFCTQSFPGVDLSAYNALYFQAPWRIGLLCTADVPDWRDDPGARARDMYDLVHLETVYVAPPEPWIGAGVGRALKSGERRNDRVRLNRRMVSALAEGTAWSDELLKITAARAGRMLLKFKDPRRRRRAHQLLDQAWSLVEYLGGEEAPEERRAGFRAFLRAPRSSARGEETFFRHLGFGYGTLLDDWREWVRRQGIGPDEPPTDRTRDWLTHYLVPKIRDRQEPLAARIKAIGEWVNLGYALGADTLIELLPDPGDIPRDHIVWALSRVSGTVGDIGDDPALWNQRLAAIAPG